MSRSAKNRATPITVVAATNYSTSTGTSIGPVDSETSTPITVVAATTSTGTSIGPVDSETTTAVATTSHSTSAGTSIGPADGETWSPNASTHTNTVDQEYLQVRPGCYCFELQFSLWNLRPMKALLC